MKTQNSAVRSFLTILALAVIGGLAALVLQAASNSGAIHPNAHACQGSFAAYEQAIARAERASDSEAHADALLAAHQRAYEDYADCLRLAGSSGAAALEMTPPPPTFPRPPMTPPPFRGTPPVQPPRGTPRMTPPMTPPGRMMTPPFAPPLTPPGRMMTPPGPPPTRVRPPMTGTPGPWMTPPGPTMTPPGRMMTPPGPPITPPGK